MGKEGYYNTPNWNRGSIESKLKEKYQGFTYEFFVSKNLLPQLSELSIKDLKYYQDEINLDNLDEIEKNTSRLEEPVLVIRDGNHLILYNGYHRTTIHILNNKPKVKGYVFDIV